MTKEDAIMWFEQMLYYLAEDEWNKDARDAANMALDALRSPWVKTSNRLPDAEQIARNDKIFLLCKQHGGAYEAYTHWADGLASHPEKFEFDYWMPVPPLPEVSSETG